MVWRSTGSRDDAARRGERLAPHLHRLAAEVKPAAAAIADFLLPRACTVCERPLAYGERGLVCGRCWALLPGLPWPRCDRCGHPTYGESCRWCELLPPFVRAARSVAWAAGHVGLGVVHALKYGGWHRVAGELSARMARCEWPRDVVEERAAIIPVPLSEKRQRERGYNQSERLARGLADAWRIPLWNDVLTRTRHTETQTRLAPDERFRNVTGAFSARVAARDALRGAHVVLVDDVVTTAATLNACAAALCAGGARIVSFVTFGRAPALGDRL
ncbi:MAG TPA: double zinc ribbon domain-containing protein [Gemmatimonadaceae bacterium]|jgi:ComF family protein|nr:double zinc ribbon domain-containing protein [Gemmatimonadaceae bacterium]